MGIPRKSARQQLRIVMAVAVLALVALATLALWSLKPRTGSGQTYAGMPVPQQMELVLGVTVLLAVIVSGVCVSAARSISRPLRLLTAAANEAADTSLPQLLASLRLSTADTAEPACPTLVIEGSNELVELAAAFNSMQQAAVGAAVEQARSRRNTAQIFVNLGRRNQVLLKRTLAFVSELEQNERDPAALEHLFRLDHLVTRMRRNAESLLVLAGAEPSRTWSEPVDVGYVLQAAMSEIEDYTRVQLVLLHPIAVRGNAAANVTHLLAELLENATNFSAPSTRVKVTGKPRPDGTYLISIVDKGIGMTPDELVEANRRIRDVGAVDERPLTVQGLYVVGRLAARHGVIVHFGASADEGVIVEVLLPAPLLAERQLDPDPLAATTATATSGAALSPLMPTVIRQDMAMAVQPGSAAVDTARAEFTENGLARRVPGTQLFDTGPAPEEPADGPATGAEMVSTSFSRFFESVERARNDARVESTD